MSETVGKGVEGGDVVQKLVASVELSKGFLCAKCGSLQKTADGLKRHMSRNHPELPDALVCQNEGCKRNGMPLSSINNLRTHQMTCQKKKPNKCFLCHRVFSTLAGKLNHEAKCKEKNSGAKCPKCGSTFRLQRTCRIHTQQCRGPVLSADAIKAGMDHTVASVVSRATAAFGTIPGDLAGTAEDSAHPIVTLASNSNDDSPLTKTQRIEPLVIDLPAQPMSEDQSVVEVWDQDIEQLLPLIPPETLSQLLTMNADSSFSQLNQSENEQSTSYSPPSASNLCVPPNSHDQFIRSQNLSQSDVIPVYSQPMTIESQSERNPKKYDSQETPIVSLKICSNNIPPILTGCQDDAGVEPTSSACTHFHNRRKSCKRRKFYPCEYCGKQISLKVIATHQKACKDGEVKPSILMQCNICGRKLTEDHLSRHRKICGKLIFPKQNYGRYKKLYENQKFWIQKRHIVDNQNRFNFRTNRRSIKCLKCHQEMNVFSFVKHVLFCNRLRNNQDSKVSVKDKFVQSRMETSNVSSKTIKCNLCQCDIPINMTSSHLIVCQRKGGGEKRKRRGFFGKVNENLNEYVCGLCNKKFQSSIALLVHAVRVHKIRRNLPDKRMCPFCRANIGDFLDIHKHIAKECFHHKKLANNVDNDPAITTQLPITPIVIY